MSEQNQQPEVAAEEQQEARDFQIQRYLCKRCFFLKRQIFPTYFPIKNGNQNSALI